jgi:GH43 family beta-xylosidase
MLLDKGFLMITLMKTRFNCIFLAFLAGVTPASCLEETTKAGETAKSLSLTYHNPLWDGYLADPYMFKASNGFYYAIGTGLKDDHVDNKGDLPYSHHFPIIKSKDMQNWELVGGALPEVPHLKLKLYWAPEIVENNGKFYLYYSGDCKQRVAVADKPEGPYVDSGKLLFPSVGFNIDGHPFLDPVSKEWFLYGAIKDKSYEKNSTGLAVAKLSKSMDSVEGPIHLISTAFRDWHVYDPKTGDYCMEGPSVIFKDGKYWCFYSGGNWQTPTYGVGCLVADTIMGAYDDPWSLDRGAVVCTIPDALIGPGHTSIILAPDNQTYFLVYHSWNKERTKRQICMDPIEWTKQGPKMVNPGRGNKTVKLPLEKAGGK